MTNFNGKPLGDYSSDQLKMILGHMADVLKSRDIASQHSKFNRDMNVNGVVRKKMEFPPVNPNFTKLKEEIENELRGRS